MMNVFKSLVINYGNIGDQNSSVEYSYLPTNLKEMKMMRETRPRYPSNKQTFNINKIAKGTIRFLNIHLNSPAIFDVVLFLEDSKRNFLNSI